MADPQHVEWFLEGVRAWNRRRKETDFVPDLSGENLRKLFEAKGRLTHDGRMPLLQANLRGANLRGADLFRADLREADLRGADLREANLREANLREADLSRTRYLSQDQLETMLGDSGTILPGHLSRPTHWPDVEGRNAGIANFPAETDAPPPLPETPKGNRVDLDNRNRLALGPDELVPARGDLEILFEELKDAVSELRGLGRLDNLSPLFAKGLARFLDQIPKSFVDLEQVRFGVSTQTLRLRFDSERANLSEIAPEKVGHIQAVLYVSDLIAARLPEWKSFLDEKEDDLAVFETREGEVKSVLEDAAHALETAPETFDPSLFTRVREYLEDASIYGYLAAKELLLSIAHKTFTLALDLTKETASEVRKGIIKNIALALRVELGAVLLDLAGLLPKELQWLVNWLNYLPTLLG